MRRDFVAAFPFLKMSFSAKHDLDSDSDIEMNIQPCQFEPRRGKCDVTPNTIRTMSLSGQYFDQNFGNGQLKGSSYK